MSLTITHNNGKFTCDFTPDGEASVQINSSSPVKVNVDVTGLADQELNRENKDTAERGKVTFTALEEVSKEEDTAENGKLTSSDLEEMSTDTIYVGNSPKRERK